MKTILYLIILFLFFSFTATTVSHAATPKLVVVIAVDQMPYDYMARFAPYFSDRGFNYLATHGANFVNASYDYAYLKTACGFSVISTGSYIDATGQTGNSWFDVSLGRNVNAVEDTTAPLIGSAQRGRSPRNLKTTTLGDMVRLAGNFHSKSIGISGKDRSAITLGGKSGTAYWMIDSLAVTSAYYMNALPEWVSEFNGSGIFRRYLGRTWDERHPDLAARLCDLDDAPYEATYAGVTRTFPHVMPVSFSEAFFSGMRSSPFDTEILLEFSKRAVSAESLGARGVTDFLGIGITATDIVGHDFGPNSREVFDNILRTDSLIGDFLSFLDRTVGLKNCLIALSSDHGIAPIPEYLKKRIPESDAGRVSEKDVTGAATGILERAFGTASQPWVRKTVDAGIWLNPAAAKEKGIALADAAARVRDSLSASLPVAAAYTRFDIERGISVHDRFGGKITRSYYSERSGDVLFVLKPYYILSGSSTGTNHGMPYAYDSHVPLMIMGEGIMPGTYATPASPADIAPTLAVLMGIDFPPARQGRVLEEALGKKKETRVGAID